MPRNPLKIGTVQEEAAKRRVNAAHKMWQNARKELKQVRKNEKEKEKEKNLKQKEKEYRMLYDGKPDGGASAPSSGPELECCPQKFYLKIKTG